MSVRTLVLAPLTVAALAGVACGSDDGSGGEPADAGIAVTLSDFEIEMEDTSASAGSVSFAITNAGGSVHEFEVLRTETPADVLPVDSGIVQTTANGIEIVDEVEEIAPGTGADLVVQLEAGSYAVICNVSDHYESGMYAAFTVE
jgi:iron uptake system component EfeO